mmetsp:Transcript_2434/g.6345  ORF Transcript_2434/g.6345 Transcript_2434/m.6345 type:complete len:238 (+) Transcript_2434:127-840(+)
MFVSGNLAVDGNLILRQTSVINANTLVSNEFNPLKLESNYRTGVKIKVSGDDIVMVTSSGMEVNGTLRARDGIITPSVKSDISNLTLGSTESMSVEFEVGNFTIGRVDSLGISVDAGSNFVAPIGSAVMFGDMPVFADHSTPNWRSASPVLRLDGAKTGGGSLLVSNDLQVEEEAFFNGSTWFGEEIVLANPNTLRHPEPPTNSASQCITGALRWDNDFLFLCVEGGTWKRAPLSSF